MFINGVKFYESTHCVEDQEITRSWKERLFSWPWRPWRKTKTIQVPAIYSVENPSQGLFAVGPPRFFVAHPSKVAELRAALGGDDKTQA